MSPEGTPMPSQTVWGYRIPWFDWGIKCREVAVLFIGSGPGVSCFKGVDSGLALGSSAGCAGGIVVGTREHQGSQLSMAAWPKADPCCKYLQQCPVNPERLAS